MWSNLPKGNQQVGSMARIWVSPGLCDFSAHAFLPTGSGVCEKARKYPVSGKHSGGWTYPTLGSLPLLNTDWGCFEVLEHPWLCSHPSHLCGFYTVLGNLSPGFSSASSGLGETTSQRIYFLLVVHTIASKYGLKSWYAQCGPCTSIDGIIWGLDTEM